MKKTAKNKKIFTIKDYEKMSWHDNHLYGVSWQYEESIKNDLILDIDYISEWVLNKDKTYSFKIAPANLVFHNIRDLKMNIDWKSKAFQGYYHGGIPLNHIDKVEVTHKEQKFWDFELGTFL